MRQYVNKLTRVKKLTHVTQITAHT